MTRSDARLVGLVFLSLGILINFGDISTPALLCVLLSVALCVYSFSLPVSSLTERRRARLVMLIALAADGLFYDFKFGNRIYLFTFAGIAAAILVYSLVPGRLAKLAAGALAATSSLAGIAGNMIWGFADIDVFHFQQNASQALLRGQNPYTPLVSSPETIAPGVGAWIPLHLPYGPVLPVLEAPLRVLGDVRLLHVLAGVATAVCALVLARRAGTVDRTACLVMAFPLTVGMVLLSWVDIVTMAGLAAWLVLFRTRPRLATLTLAVALGIKPTTLIALVPIFYWSVAARRQILTAVALALVFVLPFAAVTGFPQFYHDVVGIQLDVYPRLDSLTLDSYLYALHLPLLPFAVSALVIALTAVFVLRQKPVSYGDLLTGTAVLVTVSFLVAKWAYFNYYYIPAVLLLLAVAGDALALDAPELLRPPALVATSQRFLQGLIRRSPAARRLPSPSRPLLPGDGGGPA